MCSSELDEIGHAHFGLRGNVCKVAADARHGGIHRLSALIGEDERAITSSREAIVKCRSDSRSGRICALAVCRKLLGEGGGDLRPDGGASTSLGGRRRRLWEEPLENAEYTGQCTLLLGDRNRVLDYPAIVFNGFIEGLHGAGGGEAGENNVANIH